ncbi:hypothetical protein Ancab_019351 [Ancistrocladus abbreviatus]
MGAQNLSISFSEMKLEVYWQLLPQLESFEQSDVPKEEGEVFQTHTNSVEENGGAPPTRDMDEIMTEVEAAGINDMTIEKVRRKQLILSFWCPLRRKRSVSRN